MSHHNYRHGKFSRYQAVANRQLADRYKQALEDPELNEFRRDAALLEARVDELLKACESELLWAKAQAAFERLSAAIRSKGDEDLRASLTELHDLLTRGYRDSLRWAEIYDVVEQAGRAKERELKRLVSMGYLVSVEEAVEQIRIFVDRMIDAVQSAVKDRAVLKEVINNINAVVNKTPGLVGDDGGSTGADADVDVDVDDDGAEPRALSLIGMKRYRGQ